MWVKRFSRFFLNFKAQALKFFAAAVVAWLLAASIANGAFGGHAAAAVLGSELALSCSHSQDTLGSLALPAQSPMRGFGRVW